MKEVTLHVGGIWAMKNVCHYRPKCVFILLLLSLTHDMFYYLVKY